MSVQNDPPFIPIPNANRNMYTSRPLLYPIIKVKLS